MEQGGEVPSQKHRARDAEAGRMEVFGKVTGVPAAAGPADRLRELAGQGHTRRSTSAIGLVSLETELFPCVSMIFYFYASQR